MNSSELVAIVRNRNAKWRDSQELSWQAMSNFAVRKFLYLVPYQLRLLDSSVWRWLGLLCLGAIAGHMWHVCAGIFVVTDLASILILQTLVAVVVVCFVGRKKYYLDQLDVPLLDHFSTLPWSNHRLLAHFLVAALSRSGFSLGYWTLSGLHLHYTLKIVSPPTLAIAMMVSLAVCASLFVCKLFMGTVDSGSLRKWFLAASIFAPFAWPYGLLWLSTEGASAQWIIASIACCCLAVTSLFSLTLERLYRRLAIIEFVGHTPASFAIPISEKAGFLDQQRQYEQASVEYPDSTLRIPSIESALRTERSEGSLQWKHRLDYSKEYWSRQGWVGSMAERFLSDREKQIVAVAESLRNERDFPARIIRLYAFHFLFSLFVFCLMWLSQLSVVGFLFGSIAKILLICFPFATIQFVSPSVSNVAIKSLRAMPYSSREIVWALVKRCWIESVFLLPIVLITAVFSVYRLSSLSLGNDLPRVLLIATVLLFSIPMTIISFGLHEQTRQSAINRETLRFVLGLLVALLSVAVSGCLMILGGAFLATLGALLAMRTAYGIANILIDAYRSTQLDVK